MFRTTGKPEFAYEHELMQQEDAKRRFFFLDENIRRICETSLRDRGLVDSVLGSSYSIPLKSRYPQNSEGQLIPSKMGALTLAQLRILRPLLQRCFTSKAAGQADSLAWEEATSRHLWSKCKTGYQALEEIKPRECRLSQCFQTEDQQTDYFVSCSWDIPLVEMFDAIEWHAEARSLPDRATYFVDALCQGPEDRPNPLGTVGAGVGFVLVLGAKVMELWEAEKPSLWMLYEIFQAQELGLSWDLTSVTGTLATTRPFDNGCWAFGAFDPTVAQRLLKFDFRASACRCRPDDRQLIMDQLQKAYADGVLGFENRLNSVIPASVLGSALSQCTYFDSEGDMEMAFVLAQQAQELRNGHLSAQRLLGAFGESCLHIAAAGSRGERGIRCMLDLFLNLGLDINHHDSEGDTPLHWAAFAGSAAAVNLLLSMGANPFIENFSAFTPLQVVETRPAAFLEGHSEEAYSECKTLLLQAYAQRWLSSPRGGTLQRAKQLFANSDEKNTGKISRSELREVLVRIGSSKDVVDQFLKGMDNEVDYFALIDSLGPTAPLPGI